MERSIRTLIRITFLGLALHLSASCFAWPAGFLAGVLGQGGAGGGSGSGLIALLFGGGSGASLKSIEISPSNGTLAKGTSLQLTATGVYTDGTTQDLTSRSGWNSSNSTLITFSGAGLASSQAAASTGTVTVSVSYSGLQASTNLTVSNATIQSLQVDPVFASVASGFTRQFHATGIFSDNSTQDLTSDPAIAWSSSSSSASVDSTGLVTGNGAGSASIMATYGAKSAGSSVTVTSATLAGLQITPIAPSIADNTTEQFTATGTFSDSTTQILTGLASWSSSVPDIATIGTNTGVADAGSGGGATTSTGTTTISANYGGKSDSTALNVQSCSLSSISVTPNNPIAYGTTQQFTATASYSNCPTQEITNDVIWASGTTSVATISNASATKGLATSVSAGDTLVSATLGAVTGSTTLTVKIITLQSIAVLPADGSSIPGETISYRASGTYSDGTVQDLTTQVLWSSRNTAVASISNTNGTRGTATSAATGTTTISAVRNGVTGSTSLTVAADTAAPALSSVEVVDGTHIRVTYSEDVRVAEAGLASNYRVAETVSGLCSDDTNFTSSSQTADFSISSVSVLSPSRYLIAFSAGTQQKNYTLIAKKSNIQDLAGNGLSCENTKSFAGIDAVPPYMVSAISNTPTTVVVKFNEAMLTGGGAGAADNAASYSIAENPADAGCTDVSITSVTAVDSATFQLNLNGGVCAIHYRVSSTTVKDAHGNVIGTPDYLTFTGNEQIKVVSAEALSTTTVKLTFSKPLLTGGSSGAACSSISDCSTRYRFSTNTTGICTDDSSLGCITQATVSGNVVTLTHQLEQQGVAYTVMVANATDGDGFNNGSFSLRNSDNTENIQKAPRDRATFIGAGNPFNRFQDGSYFVDPFVDGTSFSWAFAYGGRVYLGTNDLNNAAFRFDPAGTNSVLTSFAFSAGTCPAATGFGYNASGTCGADNIGPNGEYGVVGFTSATVTISGTNYEILMVGPIKNGVTRGYITQDLDTELNWTEFSFTVTGGANTKSVQSPYAVDDHLYLCMSSDHGQQAPICSYHTLTASGGVVQVATGADMSIRSNAVLGKSVSATFKNTSEIIGVDSVVKYNGNLYMANNLGVAYSSSFDTNFNANSHNATPSGFSGTTLVLNSLGKIRPGEKGIPYLREYNGKLYMARNVAAGSTAPSWRTVAHGELWVCDPAGGSDASVCEPGDWTRLISGAESELPATNAISVLQSNGSGVLYVGFDDTTASPTGVRIFRIAGTPTSTGGVSMSTGGWTGQGSAGFGTGSNRYFYSSASISDGTSNYIYVTTGSGTGAIKVFRQVD